MAFALLAGARAHAQPLSSAQQLQAETCAILMAHRHRGDMQPAPNSRQREAGATTFNDFVGPTITCGAEKFATERGILHPTYLSIGFNDAMSRAVLISELFSAQTDLPFGLGHACVFERHDGAWRFVSCQRTVTFTYGARSQPPVKP